MVSVFPITGVLAGDSEGADLGKICSKWVS